MILSLKNIGKLKSTSVKIKGITAIAGENNTGKSTVGKTLFGVFNSFYNVDEQIDFERSGSIENLISLMYRNVTNQLSRRFDVKEIARSIIEHSEFYNKKEIKEIKEEIIDSILQYDENFEKYIVNSNIDDVVLRIVEVLSISDTEILKSVLSKQMDVEFNGQINNIFSGEIGEVKLQIKNEQIEIFIEDNNVINVTNRINLHTEAVYLDDPFVLDQPQYPIFHFSPKYMDHRMHLREKLSYNKDTNIVDEIVVNQKFDKIYEKISSICSGELIKNKQSGYGYKKVDTEKILDVRNLSTGLKTFAILKTLLVNRVIEYNGLIILDEPEIHLHPEWQLLFAELIVMLHKEFRMHILLNTHSPYFLRAIQVYSAKHEVADKCNYYLSEEMGEQVTITDVTNDINRIYAKLSKPLQDLEDERWKND